MSTNQITNNIPPSYFDEPPIGDAIEAFFNKYASIPPSQLREHLIRVRDQAWGRCNYPCLGRWRFLQFSIRENPIYEEVLEKCKHENATLIDFGCCLGQDLRQLVHDGVSLNQLRGYELDPFFIEQGYELFRDESIMKEKKIFTSGDIFDDQLLNTIEPADYLHVSSFIHLFDAETQRVVCQRLSRLAKRAIFGRQVGSSVPGEYPRQSGSSGSKMMRHSPESFTQMWDDISNGEWKVETAVLKIPEDSKYANPTLAFVIRKTTASN